MRSSCAVSVTSPVDLGGRFPAQQTTAASQLTSATCSFLSCRLWRTGSHWSIPTRTLDHLFLFLPVAGDLVISSPSGRETLDRGRLAMVPPGVAHAIVHARGTRTCRVLAVHAQLTSATGEPWPLPDHPLVARLDDPALWIAQLTRLAGLCQDHPELGGTLGRLQIRSLLIDVVLGGHPMPATGRRIDPRLAAVIAQVRSDPAAGSSLSELARRQGIGPLRLRQLCHAGLGCSPKSLVDRLRLAHAAGRLHGGASVADTARSCGFASARQLQERFKRAYGCPPSRWRERQDSEI
jgi:AraC-like DNA-binding protein